MSTNSQFKPSEVFKSIGSSHCASPVRKDGDCAWIEKVSPSGVKYRIQAYGVISTGCYHDHASFNSKMSIQRADRNKKKALCRDFHEECERWPSQIRSSARAGTTFVLRPALEPSEVGKTEAVRPRRHGDQLGHPLGRIYA